MGNAKALPVVGEVITTVESGVKITAAGACALVGEDKAAKELAEGAGNAWVEYSEKNLLAGTIRSTIHRIDGNVIESERVAKSTLVALGGVVDSVPVVGHVKGVVHYIAGDTEGGNQSMIAASRSTAVLGAGLATGGLGAGVVAGGMVGIGGGIAYDGVHSAIDSAVNDERKTHGLWNIDQDVKNCKTSNDIADFELGLAATIVGDFVAGSSAAKAGKNLINANTIKKLKNELKNIPDIDPDLALKDTIDAARDLKKNVKDGTVKRDGHVSTKVRNLKTDETGQGFSARARSDINVNEFNTNGPKENGFPSKTQAKKAAMAESKFMKDHPDVNPVGTFKPQSCAEHAAMDSLPSAPSAPSVLQMVSVKFTNGVYQTVARCESCLTYAEAMGTVVTDLISEGLTVPTTTKTIRVCVSSACKCGAIAVGAAIVFDASEINRNQKSDKIDFSFVLKVTSGLGYSYYAPTNN